MSFGIDKDDIEAAIALAWQRQARIAELDNEAQAAYQQGYMVDVDRLLDERQHLMRLVRQGSVA
jgi:NOL1/NOP2/fmu family ribosome biogenesis protein